MTDVRGILQTALDDALSSAKVRVYWLRKAETTGEAPEEYVVYTLDGDPAGVYADDQPLTRSANVVIRYYYRGSKLDTAAGRSAVKARETVIAEALEGAGFSLPSGYFDAGDIDDIGFGTTVFEAYYWRVV